MNPYNLVTLSGHITGEPKFGTNPQTMEEIALMVISCPSRTYEDGEEVEYDTVPIRMYRPSLIEKAKHQLTDGVRVTFYGYIEHPKERNMSVAVAVDEFKCDGLISVQKIIKKGGEANGKPTKKVRVSYVSKTGKIFTVERKDRPAGRLRKTSRDRES